MAGEGSHSNGHAMVKHGHHSSGSLKVVLLHAFLKLKWLGLMSLFIEAMLESRHVSKRAHKYFHFLHKPWVHLALVIMEIVGHLAEHLHQEEENHEQEHRLHELEKVVAKLSKAK
mmetsp:Transcript_40923/g.61831  ORF Transcript_40923/g.61831 Transcript_40923/m.61831 type:complete len:115 (-) Transcript_40923:328-672(-)|eukprot:CAMPEP_0194764100 /NCGR_PEP_ID=MMETSP0323_2-20130528/21078_1 /TAXON_ID=2866 ORGANISM="Crypthecodinium cohnii, Strain Seligo" /NCGR_SAMPLE_ID=MMETSP0323_2 /ASSEMBLY_ACC=CAM_ASM_000346 /LENGTH=114 /DNA_ID=CAMNT_0039690441 /DNA_START=69 /DNA_END=413 /DNA_ORIENTATION=+